MNQAHLDQLDPRAFKEFVDPQDHLGLSVTKVKRENSDRSVHLDLQEMAEHL